MFWGIKGNVAKVRGLEGLEDLYLLRNLMKCKQTKKLEEFLNKCSK